MSGGFRLIRDIRNTKCGSPTAKAVALALATYADASRTCYPSFVALSADTEFSVRAVKTAINTLRAAGIVEIISGGGRGHSNRYRINPKPETVQEVPVLVQEVHSLNGAGGAQFDAETVQEVPQTVQHVPQTVQEVHPNCHELPITAIDDDNARETSDLTFREKVIMAMGHDVSGMTATGRMVGNPTDMLSARRWVDDLGLSENEVVQVIEAIASKPRYQPVTSFNYFNRPMAEHAGAKNAPTLKPVEGRRFEREPTEGELRHAMGREALAQMAKEFQQ